MALSREKQTIFSVLVSAEQSACRVHRLRNRPEARGWEAPVIGTGIPFVYEFEVRFVEEIRCPPHPLYAHRRNGREGPRRYLDDLDALGHEKVERTTHLLAHAVHENWDLRQCS